MKKAVAYLFDFQANIAKRVGAVFARENEDLQQLEVQPIAGHPRIEMPKWPYAG